ncbi:MAG: hypothetical protein ACN6QT_36415 [Burkholderia contaminans]|uniref:Uncharacterized protein n=1 Tax=Burkholderia contaminans TaxID=488447 RepID=A0AAP4VG95_9BURK|nr:MULTISPECIES: hypothetical protein [Burkholderia]MBD1410534.1 hypothetical protein [Burkholderia contaminans]MBM6427378.1 hypothetical protein [Burkholderia contaminans]MCA7875645.1 hypothetical protein [Burkholderia contaminans]MDN7564345.1 hypothetical protein [Burkholderia contaminans]MDN8024096.1 hypothetical protein [Burkholderia contaminans]
MNKLLKRLLGFLFPGVDDGGDPPDLSGDPGSGDAGAGDAGSGDPGAGGSAGDPADDDFDFDFVEPAAPARRATSDADRLAALEAEVERRGRLVDATRTAPPAPITDRDFEAEEARLRDPNLDPMERWQIQSNRTLRQSQQAAQAALFQAQDLRDQTLFESKIASDPHRARYRDRVEAAVQEERRAGRNASREAVYYYMLGKDIADGKLKPKAKAKAPAADVPRGKTPGVRSTVPPARGQTEHQKRAARLADVNI